MDVTPYISKDEEDCASRSSREPSRPIANRYLSGGTGTPGSEGSRLRSAASTANRRLLGRRHSKGAARCPEGARVTTSEADRAVTTSVAAGKGQAANVVSEAREVANLAALSARTTEGT